MEVQLLLLVALIGPFCTFTHANPAFFTERPDVWITVKEVRSYTTEGPKGDITVAISAAPDPAVASEEVSTKEVTKAHTSVLVNTAEPETRRGTEAAVSAAPTSAEPLLAKASAVETTTATEPAETEVQATAGHSSTEGFNLKPDPTHFPPTPDVASTAVVEAASHLPTDDTTHIITGPPPTGPATAPEEAVTEDAVAVTEAASVTPAPVSTEKNVIETEAPATAAPTTPAPLLTDSPAVETAAPTEPAETELQPVATGALETHEEVVVENGTDEEQLSSGQVVGIVIGALLAVVIVIAVVIAVFRRMGKYSP